jgi:two-component system sensor histidine kinase DegS
MKKAEALSTYSLDSINKVIYELRPILLDDFGLVAATKALMESTLKGQSIKTRIKIIGQERRLPSTVEVVLFRVIQEATQNIVRHAHSQDVSVSLYFQKNSIRVRIKDNGIGFNIDEAIRSKDRPRGLGLLGMKERVELVRGTFNLYSQPGGGGTEINATIPC